MPLDVSQVATGQVIQAAHVYQFYNLLTGAMTDQAVSLKNQVNIGGNHGAGVVPLTVSGVGGQTADLFDVKNSVGTIMFGISAAGAITFAGGVTVSAGGITVAGASTFQSGGVTIQAGGEVITAGGLQVTSGNVGIGSAPLAQQSMRFAGTTTAVAGSAIGIAENDTLVASANNDSLYGLYVSPTFNDNAKTGVKHYGMFNGGYTWLNDLLGVGVDPLVNSNCMVRIQGTVPAQAAQALAVSIQTTLTAQANNDALYALLIQPTFNDNAKTGVNHVLLSAIGADVYLGKANMAAADTNGYTSVSYGNSVPTGVPNTGTGLCPIRFNAGDQKLYAYMNGGWRSVALV